MDILAKGQLCCSSRETRLPLWEFGCLRFSALQTETLACLLEHPVRNTTTHTRESLLNPLCALFTTGINMI